MSVLLEILGAGLLVVLFMALRLLLGAGGASATAAATGCCALGACRANCDRADEPAACKTTHTNP